MEADEVTEETQRTNDPEKHLSSKDPSTKDLPKPATTEPHLESSTSVTILEPHISKSPLKPSTSDTLLEMYTSKTLLEPSTSKLHLENHSSESPLVLSNSQTPFETYVSKTLLESSVSKSNLENHISKSLLAPSASETPLETHISKTLWESPITETHLEHHSSESLLVPSTSELPPLESHTSKISLGLLITENPSEHPTSASALEPSTSKTPLEAQSSKVLSESHSSEKHLEHSTSETHLNASISDATVESPISKGSEKHPSLLPSSEGHVSVPPSEDDALRESLSSKSSYSEAQWPRKSTLEAPELENLKKSFLSGISDQVHKDMATGQKGKAEDDEEEMVASGSSAHTPTPGQKPCKKKEKKAASRYTVHSVVPAKQTELVEVSKAMHRNQCGAQVNHLFQWEKHAALSAIQTGLYIGWRCPHYQWDCFRIGDESKCFCGHLLNEHQIISDISVPCGVSQCRCLMFCFIPSRPEEVGEFWLTRRATFDPKAWRAQCRCKHSHEDHTATGAHACRHHDCCCNCFESNFLCAACDRRWEEHETFFETEEAQQRGGRPYGADYMPFAEMPVLQETIFRSSDFTALGTQGPSDHPSSHPGPPGLPSPRSP